MNRFYRSPSFWGTTFLTLFAIAPLLRPGYFWSAHDARHDVFFILQYNITWDEGVLFPRWSPDWAFGYGYPFFSLVAPGATFLGTVLFRLLPLTLEASVKGTFVIIILLSAWSMWFFMRSWRGERAALVAAVAYVYVPYHLLDIFVRATMGEALALALLPLALWAVREATRKPSPGGVIAVALSYAAIHLSHNFVALIATPLLISYAIMLSLNLARGQQSWRQRFRVWLGHTIPPGMGLGLGLSLAGSFVFPALLEFQFVRSDQWYGGYYDFHDHFVYFSQLFDPRWGYGISTPGPDDPMSFQLGLVLFLLAVIAFWQWLRHRSGHHLEVGFWLLILVVGTLSTTAIATWAWDHVPLVSSAQFPWRYLAISSLALAILAPIAMGREESEGPLHSWLLPLLLAGLIILASAPYLHMQTPPPPPGGATLAGLMEFERSTDEMTGMTITAAEIATWSPLADLHMAGRSIDTQVDYGRVFATPGLSVDAREHRVDSELVWVSATSEGLRVPFYRQWFPGWTATLLDPETGRMVAEFALSPEDTYAPYGLLNVPVPAGEHLLRIHFQNTPIRDIGNILSIVTLLILLTLALWHGWRRRAGSSAS